jgi:oligopeptide transport system permease protein
MGTYFVQSILNLDRGLIMGAVLVFSATLIFFNLVVDILYAAVDPRIRLET